MINPAIIIYTFLLQFRRFDKGDFILHSILLLLCFGVCLLGPDGIYFGLSFLVNPCVLFSVACRFATDMIQHGDEYCALLFTRPIKRSTYVFSKVVVAWLGTQLFVWKVLAFFLLAEICTGTKPLILLTGWEIINVIVNSLSISTLSLFVIELPRSWRLFSFLVITGSFYIGSTMAFTFKPEGLMEHFPVHQTDGALSNLGQFLYPIIDLESIFHASTLSYGSIISFVSNMLLYLLLATYILNRREFSYAKDTNN